MNSRYDYEYFVDKGLKADTMTKFELGFMYEDRSMDFCYGGFLSEALKTMKDSDKRFINHILIPIFDLWGNIASVQGRNLNPGVTARDTKCDNTPYKKKEVLYGLNFAVEEILKKGFCTIVEGPFDLMLLNQEGVGNVVATLGTSLSLEHLVLLSFFTDTLIILYDGDKTGYDKMFDIYNRYWKEMNILFCILPTGWDPDTFIVRYGKDELTKRIYSYEDLLDNQIREKLRY